MKFSMVSGDVLKLECGALVVGIPAGGLTPTAEALDKASEGAVSRWIEAGDIHPCVGKVLISPCRLSLKTTTNHGDAYARLFKL